MAAHRPAIYSIRTGYIIVDTKTAAALSQAHPQHLTHNNLVRVLYLDRRQKLKCEWARGWETQFLRAPSCWLLQAPSLVVRFQLSSLTKILSPDTFSSFHLFSSYSIACSWNYNIRRGRALDPVGYDKQVIIIVGGAAAAAGICGQNTAHKPHVAGAGIFEEGKQKTHTTLFFFFPEVCQTERNLTF